MEFNLTDYPPIGYQKEDRTAEHRTPNFEGIYPYISVHQMFGFKKQSPVNYFIIRYWVFDIRNFITSTQYARSQYNLWGHVPSRTGPIPSQDSLRRFEFSHPQMGTVFRLILYAGSETQAQIAADRAFALVDSLNASMSDYLPESELNLLCATAGSGASVPVSDDLWAILKLADRYSRKTKGAFDATIGPVTRLWRRARNLKELPDSGRVEAARILVGYQALKFKKGQKIELKRAGMRLDLGGIAQGYAADRCLEILRKNGIRKAMVDAGGDLALGDAPPGALGWSIALPEHRVELRSRQAGKMPQTLRLANCGITTSGASYRFLEVEGKRYSHLVDPRTGWGLTHHTLVTVKAPNATSADAWATAISVMGKSGWDALPQKPKRTKVWLTESKL